MKSLSRARPELVRKYQIKSLALFGSVSRGEDTPDSDVDVLVEFSQPIGIEFISLAYELEALLGRKVDLVSRGGIKHKYFKAIEQELLYV